MSGRCVVLLALAGCGFRVPITPDDAGVTVDVGGLDPDADIELLCTTWDAQHFEACDLAMPAPSLDLDESHSPYTYDTTVAGGQLRNNQNTVLYESTVTFMQSDNSVVALANVEGFRLGANARLDVIGTKPLLLASWSEIDIAGILDAGSHIKETNSEAHIWSTTHLGAGANPPCGNRAGMPGTVAVMSGGSGGGGGGGFGGSGGSGAGGDNCGPPECPRPGGMGGVKLATTPIIIRGGCPGGTSGAAGTGAMSPANAQTVSAGGGGGGAIELAARTRIGIRATGQVLAGGAGGAGSQVGAANGGGGGGSGGYIGLDSTSVIVMGTVAANGGGGGGSGPFITLPARGWPGSDGQPSAVGAPGGDGASLHPPTAVPVCGVSGVAGGAASPNGMSATMMDACGGGGGGGGAGFVMVFATTFDASSGTISPAPSN